MAVNTKNSYGTISITEEAIAVVTGHAALECYGIVSLVSRKISDSVSEMLQKKNLARGVHVSTFGDKIFIDLYVIVKYGVSINAVAQSLKETVKYSVEKFTGMIVDTVNVNIIGVKL